MDNKVFEPITIPETPFPQQEAGSFIVTRGSTGDVYTPGTIQDIPMPRKVFADETIASSLNTKSKKILGEYGFTESGAIQIGKYNNGISGDVRITPGGITARNQAGDTTFNLDADTGDAVFKGTVQAADFTVIDEHGLVSLAAFSSGNVERDSSFETTSGTPVQITDMSLTTPSFIRNTNILVLGTASVYTAQASSGDWDGEVRCFLYVDGVNSGQPLRMRMHALSGDTSADITTLSTFTYETLSAGTHTIAMYMSHENLSIGNAKSVGLGFKLTYLVLGS